MPKTRWKRLLIYGVPLCLVLSIPIGYFSYSVGITLGFRQPLVRPTTVSAGAKYVSIIKNGTWFDCSIDSRRNVNVCTAWDYKGRLLITGDFRLKGQNRAATKDELYPSAIGPKPTHEPNVFDKNTIYLFDGPGYGNIWTRSFGTVT